MSTAAIRFSPRYSVDDYETWEGDWELWNGVAVSMSPSPTYDHQSAAMRIAVALTNQLRQNSECRCEVVVELDWRIDRNTIVRPDVSLLCQGHPGQFISYPPSVIAEILSDSTRSKDATVKRDLYEQQGVKYYLLVNPADRSLEALELVEGSYRPQNEQKGIVEFDLEEDCKLTIQLSSIFPR